MVFLMLQVLLGCDAMFLVCVCVCSPPNPWIWGWHDPLKQWEPFTQHSVRSEKIRLNIFLFFVHTIVPFKTLNKPNLI